MLSYCNSKTSKIKKISNPRQVRLVLARYVYFPITLKEKKNITLSVINMLLASTKLATNFFLLVTPGIATKNYNNVSDLST